MPKRPSAPVEPESAALAIAVTQRAERLAHPVMSVRGARQNNLQGIDCEIPLGVLNVVTGPSGSGKSSLAFETIYAEGQRRYVETFSPYTRQFFDRMDKPQVDEIVGIPPAIAIEQTNSVKSTRSTVGTITEINDYFKLLFPKLARGFSPKSGREIRPETAASVLATLLREWPDRTVLLTFGVPAPVGTAPAEFFGFLQHQGYLRVYIEGKVLRTDNDAGAAELKKLPPVVSVIQDRITLSEENRQRLSEGIEACFRYGKGRLEVVDSGAGGEVKAFSRGWHDPYDGVTIREPSAGLFSFNNPLGACPKCNGFGRVIGLDIDKVLPDRSLSIKQGLVKAFTGEVYKESQRDLIKACAIRDVSVTTPFNELPAADQAWVIKGEKRADGTNVEDAWQNGQWYGIEGFFEWLESNTYKMHVRVFLSRFRGYHRCPVCGGGRFQPEALNYRLVPDTQLASVADAGSWINPPAAGIFVQDLESYTLPDIFDLPVERLRSVINRVHGVPGDRTADLLLREIDSRLGYLEEVGLGYLTLDRSSRTLSGGELARVNLTTCLGASLTNTLFVLDEPSIGMHSRDIGRLIKVMHRLRDKGNTLLVVEHEEAIIRAADNLLDIGPGRGAEGGKLIFNGPLTEFNYETASLTADYLSGRKSVPVPTQRREPAGWIRVRGARQNNLKEVNVEVPVGVMTCVTGVSGSGKSTLVHEIIYRHLAALTDEPADEAPGEADSVILETGHRLESVLLVDQSQLARTPRSTPALYLGAWEPIRDLFADLPESKAQGLTRMNFSFNSGMGRCQRCMGAGFEKVEMQFLSDLFVRCPECEGKRYQKHILRLRWNGKNVDDLLEMTVTEALGFFRPLTGTGPRKVVRKLDLLEEVGLGYLRLGQPLTTLSGGESQRLKLAAYLTQGGVTKPSGDSSEKAGRGVRLLIFDEPTTGLHFDDIALLMKIFHRLADEGYTLLIIEHNLEVAKSADWIIDLGPEGGSGGGDLCAFGTPEEVAASTRSHTGAYLRPILEDAGTLAPSLRVAEGGLGFQILDGGLKPPAPVSSELGAIRVHGAREHNLRNISIDIPRDQMVILTGLSGSGKSTLAFDILFAEGQRRFLDSMSPYARQFVEQLERPDVDLVEGLPPTVAIEQRITRGGIKSTVATVTEVYHFLRLLFAKTGTQHCPDHPHAAVAKQSESAILTQLEKLAAKGKVTVLAPLVKARKGFHTEIAEWARKHHYDQLFVDGEFKAVAGFQKLDRFREHTIDAVVDVITKLNLAQAQTVLRSALGVGKGTVRLLDARGNLTVVSTEMSCPICDRSFEELDPRLFSFNSPHGWCPTCNGAGITWRRSQRFEQESDESMMEAELRKERMLAWADEEDLVQCPDCGGKRLNEVALNVRLAGKVITDFTGASVLGCRGMVEGLDFTGRDEIIARDLTPEIAQRLKFMESVGLGYLTLDRSAPTLSGGESQRIRLAAQLGSNLRGVLYVLDEPTIGLHPRDNVKLLDTLVALRDKGNSLLIVEHDEETMQRADTVIDLGPGAGRFGGEIVAMGTLAEVCEHGESHTARCLAAPLRHPMRGERRPLPDANAETGWLRITGARANNLHNVSATIPIGRLTVVIGISGAGKSSLIRGALHPAVAAALAKPKRAESKAAAKKKPSVKTAVVWDELVGADQLETVYEVDQSPIGKTSRSTPATYLKIFDHIRDLFAAAPLSRMRGYTASRFSFNTADGRCETCKGNGQMRLEMNFLPTTYVDCPDCHCLRYNAPTLEVQVHGKTIGEVMKMTIDEAAEFFQHQPKLSRTLELLRDTGLGYLQLGQASPTLSGGEAQRIKLVTQLTRGVGRSLNERLRKNRQPKSTLYILEEPTIGLHMEDTRRLIDVLHRLTDDGNTVIVIEHQLDVICEADYLIDVGPEAGGAGGYIVATGTPEEVAKSTESRTAPFIRDKLALGAPKKKSRRKV